MYWELRCCGGKSHILTIQHRISKIAENSLVKLGIWLPYNSSLSRSMQPRQTYSPGFTNGRTDRELRQAINPSAAMLRSGLIKATLTCFVHKVIFRLSDDWCFNYIHQTIVAYMSSSHPRMCMLSTLCGSIDKHSLYIYNIYVCHYHYQLKSEVRTKSSYLTTNVNIIYHQTWHTFLPDGIHFWKKNENNPSGTVDAKEWTQRNGHNVSKFKNYGQLT